MGKVLLLPRSKIQTVQQSQYDFKYDINDLRFSTDEMTRDEALALVYESQRVNRVIQGAEGRCDPQVLLTLINYLRALHGRALRVLGIQKPEKLKIVKV